MAIVTWPFAGLEADRAFIGQSPGTTVDCLNVRAYDCATGRSRGAQRPGLSKFISAQVNSTNQVQDLIHVVSAQDTSSSLSAQNIRTLKLLAVAGGSIYRANSGSWTLATSGGSALDATQPTVFSAQLDGVVYYVDGTNYKKFTSSTNAVATWTASTAGTLPTDSSNTARLICTWRRRIVLAGIASDAHNWFMSASGDPLDFDYVPDPTRETQAVAGNQHVSGECQDIITVLYPYNDDLLIFGGDHSIWQVTGDPMAGGRIDNITDTVGMAWGRPICRDSRGIMYFVGSRGGFYRMAPGSQPERLSERRIESKLDSVNLNTTIVRLYWDDKMQEVGICLTPMTAATTTHYAWDSRNGPDGRGAFWPDQHANTDHDPLCVHVFDGDDPDDRTILFGTRNGYVLMRDYDAVDDDGTAVNSYVFIGPIKADNLEAIRLDELQVLLAEDSSQATVDVYVGRSAEDAFADTSPRRYTVYGGRNRSIRPHKSGNATYLRLGNSRSERWSFEAVRVENRPMSPLMQRFF